MAERPETRTNAIRAAVARQVAEHARDYPHLWLEVPTVYEGVSAALTDAARPWIAISVLEVRDDERGGTFTRSAFDLDIICATANAADPEGAAEAMAADVTRAVESDVTLGRNDPSQDGELVDGYLMRKSKSAVDLDTADVNGNAELVLRFEGSYAWDSDEP